MKKVDAYSKVELRPTDIVACVGGLHNHCLPSDAGAGEGEFVAATACGIRRSDGSETVGQIIIDGPRGLIGAHERCSTIAAGLGSGAVGEGFIFDVTGSDWGCDAGPGPGAGRFAAIPGKQVRVEQ